MFSRENLTPALVACLVLLSGCTARHEGGPSVTGSPPPPSPPGPTGRPGSPGVPDVYAIRPEFLDCVLVGGTIQALPEDVQRLLPSGYEARATLPGPLAGLKVSALDCRSFIIDNQTVVRDLALFLVSAFVYVNDSLQGNAETHTYLFELFASNPTVVELFQSAGLGATAGTIAVGRDATLVDVTLTVDGQPLYRMSGANGVAGPHESVGTERQHQVVNGSAARWIDTNSTSRFPSFPGASELEVNGGVLRAVRPGDAGRIPIATQMGTYEGSWSFGRLMS